MRRKFALFDLDGTLVESSPGIIGAFQEALAHLGAQVPEMADLSWVVGPPLHRSFERVLGDPSHVDAAIAHYRASYAAAGLYQAEVYAGMREGVAALRAAGLSTFVCTAKPVPFARQVVAHFGLEPYFDGIYGAELDGRFEDKGVLIAHLLAEEGLRARDGCMVGDRDNDILAAVRNNMPSVGVLWGYGSARELAENKASVLCDRPEALSECIKNLLDG